MVRLYPFETGDYGLKRKLKGESLYTTCIPSRYEM